MALSHAQAETKDLKWKIKKVRWSNQDEKNFQEFIKGIGKAVEKRLCSTVDQCVKNDFANPFYVKKNPANLSLYSDCADLPFVLRGYFSWMNDLPFSFPSAVDIVDGRDSANNIRYSSFGNKITRVRMVKNDENVNLFLKEAVNTISSAMYRLHPDRDIENGAFSDFYSPAIKKSSIKPGTVVYDPNGHVLVVYEVTIDGRILMVDAHPDGSITRNIYGDKFIRSRPAAGAGFKNWRSVGIVGASNDANGNFSGGRLVATVNAKILDFSKEQYFGNDRVITNDADWSKGLFIFDSVIVKYFDYVRRSLASGTLRYRPVTELREMLRSLCEDLKDRKLAVEEAVNSGIAGRPHPERLPRNIYGTSGEWETFSTPSRDARFKASVREAHTSIKIFIEKYRNRDPIIEYDGKDLVSDLKSTYEEESKACRISYQNSVSFSVALNLHQVLERLFSLSFDPYHCPENRWGAIGQELQSCTDNSNKLLWFKAQQKLRNVIDRNYEIRMDKSLQELVSSDIGVAEEPEINIQKLLESY